VEDMFAARRRSIMAQQAELQRQLDQLETVPNLEDYPNGTVIRSRIGSGSGPTFTWVFLKVVVPGPGDTDGVIRERMTRWYATGKWPSELVRSGRRWLTSQELARWLTEPNRIITEWTLMLPSAMNRIVAENAAGETVVDDEEAPSKWT
jgi:hypothetical protein